MTRLSVATLGRLPATVQRPGYDRAKVRAGVVHLGIGAFHRAHQALVFERALAAGDDRWGVIAASLRSPATRDALAPQDGLYTLVERDGAGERARVIGAVREVLVAPQDSGALVAALARAETHLVTLTVTEKGYWLDPAGALLTGAAPIAAELQSLNRPATAIGFLVAALAARRAARLPPFTALSCDNLPGNGARLRGAVLAMARHHEPALADWIAEAGAFPDTMVDRIVPATSPADLTAFAADTGVEDRALVVTEPYLQWVIANEFAGPRPDFENVGVQLTHAVAPWEAAKLRLLNGAHSALAYLGLLANASFVHETVAMPPLRALIERLWDESGATLTPPPGLDLARYRAALLARFANPVLAHRLRQIAQDGSQKLPQRLAAPLLERQRARLRSPALALAVAGWMRWVGRSLQPGEDPLAAPLRATADAGDPLSALLDLRAVFAEPFPAPAEIADAYRRLGGTGRAATLAALEELAV